MKRTILIVLCLAAIGTFAIVQAEENTQTPDCETFADECSCDGTVEGCAEKCDECNCDSDCEDTDSDCSNCTGCEDTDSDCDDCTGDDCDCDDCDSEEEFQHCRGCH